MANTKWSNLNAITSLADGDIFSAVDVSDVTDSASGSNRRVTFTNLVASITSITGLTTPLTVAQGGTGVASLTDGGILLGSGTGAITALGVATNGQIPIGDGATDPVLATLTEGEGIDITNGAGSITIAGEDASITNKGIVEIATIAETDTGTDAGKAVSPDGLQGSLRNLRFFLVTLIAADTNVAADTTIGGDWPIPFAGAIVQDDNNKDYFAAYTDTAGVTSEMVVDVHLNGTTIMTTNKLDIETGEKDTTTATTQPDVTTTAVSAGDILTFDVDSIHSGTAAKGLKVMLANRPT